MLVGKHKRVRPLKEYEGPKTFEEIIDKSRRNHRIGSLSKKEAKYVFFTFLRRFLFYAKRYRKVEFKYFGIFLHKNKDQIETEKRPYKNKKGYSGLLILRNEKGKTLPKEWTDWEKIRGSHCIPQEKIDEYIREKNIRKL